MARIAGLTSRAGFLALTLAWLGVQGVGSTSGESRPVDAVAFVRVLADVHVDFGGLREPIRRNDLALATGSGFVAAPSGLILTSWRVVAEEDAPMGFREEGAQVRIENRRIEVVIGDGPSQRVLDAWVAAADAENDVAALQVTAGDLKYLPLGDSDALDPGRPSQVPELPSGRRVEARKDAEDEGDTVDVPADGSVRTGNVGGPVLDADGYVVGLVRKKLARGAASPGAGVSVPINVVKDFLDASGLIGQLPVTRLRPGVRHTLDWKRLAIELPDGYSDLSTSRVLADAGEVGEIGFRAYRLPTDWPLAALEEALLGGEEVAGFVPGPVTAGRRETPVRRAAVALVRGNPPSVVGSAAGTDGSGRPVRVEYAIVDGEREKVVARYLGPSDAVAFNLGLIRRSLLSLEVEPILIELSARTLAGARDPALEVVPFPEGEGHVAAPEGWPREPAVQSACRGLPPAANGLAASHPLDYTLVLRALRWTSGGPALRHAVEACASGEGRTGEASEAGQAGYAVRFERLGVPIEARGILVSRDRESLLLELEAPVAKLDVAEGLYARWVGEVATGR